MHVWTTARRPTGPIPVGFIGLNTTLGTLEWWDGATWQSVGGGAACLDGVWAYDAAGGTPPGGIQIPCNAVGANTDPTNYGVGTVVPGAVTVLNDGDYLVSADMAVQDVGAVNHGAWQAVIQTTPSGLGAWVNLIGADGYGNAMRQILNLGGVGEAHAQGIVTAGGGLGLDIQLVGFTLVASGTEVTVPQGSRLVVTRLC